MWIVFKKHDEYRAIDLPGNSTVDQINARVGRDWYCSTMDSAQDAIAQAIASGYSRHSKPKSKSLPSSSVPIAETKQGRPTAIETYLARDPGNPSSFFFLVMEEVDEESGAAEAERQYRLEMFREAMELKSWRW